MLDGLMQIFSTLFGFVGGLLPASPFAEWAVVSDSIRLGLGWLNWFCPIAQMLAMLLVWIGCAVAVTALRMWLNAGGNVAKKVMGAVS